MKQKILNYIQLWESKCYFNGIPDQAPYELEVRNLVPSYRKIAIAILKNDYSLKSLGFSAETSKYYHIYKQIEIEQRQKYIQLKLEL
jgi:predicted phosphoadenosine phosphosulfate sulfurtransferase